MIVCRLVLLCLVGSVFASEPRRFLDVLPPDMLYSYAEAGFCVLKSQVENARDVVIESRMCQASISEVKKVPFTTFDTKKVEGIVGEEGLNFLKRMQADREVREIVKILSGIKDLNLWATFCGDAQNVRGDSLSLFDLWIDEQNVLHCTDVQYEAVQRLLGQIRLNIADSDLLAMPAVKRIVDSVCEAASGSSDTFVQDALNYAVLILMDEGIRRLGQNGLCEVCSADEVVKNLLVNLLAASIKRAAKVFSDLGYVRLWKDLGEVLLLKPVCEGRQDPFGLYTRRAAPYTCTSLCEQCDGPVRCSAHTVKEVFGDEERRCWERSDVRDCVSTIFDYDLSSVQSIHFKEAMRRPESLLQMTKSLCVWGDVVRDAYVRLRVLVQKELGFSKPEDLQRVQENLLVHAARNGVGYYAEVTYFPVYD